MRSSSCDFAGHPPQIEPLLKRHGTGSFMSSPDPTLKALLVSEAMYAGDFLFVSRELALSGRTAMSETA